MIYIFVLYFAPRRTWDIDRCIPYAASLLMAEHARIEYPPQLRGQRHLQHLRGALGRELIGSELQAYESGDLQVQMLRHVPDSAGLR